MTLQVGLLSPIARFFEAASPSEIRSMRGFVESEIELPDGPRKGDHFDGGYPRWQGELLEMMADERWLEIWLTGPRQTGKTLLGFECPLLYHLFELQEDVVCLVPEMAKARMIWQKKIEPVIRRSAYAHLLPKTGKGSRGGGDLDLIIFENGVSMHFMSGGGADPPSSATARVGVITEANEMRISETGDQGSPINAFKFCMASFGDSARIFGESIITTDACITWKQITEVGTDTRPHLRCPHCGFYQYPERERLVGWQEAADALEAAKGARYACVGCAVLWDEKDRAKAIDAARLVHQGQEIDTDGEITGEPPKTRVLGVRWNAMCHPLRTMGGIAEQEWNARRLGTDAEEMALCQYTWAVPYVPKRQVSLRPLTIAKLSRQAYFSIGQPPPQVQYLTAAVDVQEFWMYWGVFGFAFDPRHKASALADQYVLAASVENLQHPDGRHFEPAKKETEPAEPPHYWAALDRIAVQIATLFPSGQSAPIVRMMVDLGYRMDVLRPWLVQHPEWTGVIGRGDRQVMKELGATAGNRVTFLPGIADVRLQRDAFGDWNLWMLDVDQVKAQIHSGILKPAENPGRFLVPRGIEIRSRELGIAQDGPLGWLAKHLCAEQSRRDEESGQIVWEKVDGAGRHDFLDVSAYGRAAGLAHAEWLLAQAGIPNTPPPPRRTPRPTAPPVSRRHSRLLSR